MGNWGMMRFLAAGLAVLMLSACTKGKQLSHEQSCAERWEKLKSKYEEKEFFEIRLPLNELITECPGTHFTEEALFTLAESYFHLEDWIEAEAEYRSFLRNFPNSEKFAEKAHYRLAQTMANQVMIPQRDQENTVEAIDQLQRYATRYPESSFADSALQIVQKLKKQLATKELQIARLYRRMNEPQAAAIYYKDLLRKYPEHVDTREILLRLALTYLEMEQFDEAEARLSQLDAIPKDDPFRARVQEAYNELQKARLKWAARKQKEKQERQSHLDLF